MLNKIEYFWILPFSLAESTSLIWSGVAVSLHFSLGGNSTGWGAILQVLPGIYSVWLLTSILSGQGGKGLQSESTNKKDLNTHYTYGISANRGHWIRKLYEILRILKFKNEFRISSNSFRPWIVSAPVCTVTKGQST